MTEAIQHGALSGPEGLGDV